ncbi:MAG TPA: exodeoxyribonuclease VII small subunit [Alphaproteobacteria bacterium]|nr:exodeoxyribonuclease VII small subunit [Alphaproteobacteria bacterium]
MESSGKAGGAAANSEIPEDIAALSFEAAMAELEEIVGLLEHGEVDLERSIEMYSRGALLKRHCEAKLKAASEKVERIVADPGGEAGGLEPMDLD